MEVESVTYTLLLLRVLYTTSVNSGEMIFFKSGWKYATTLINVEASLYQMKMQLYSVSRMVQQFGIPLHNISEQWRAKTLDVGLHELSVGDYFVSLASIIFNHILPGNEIMDMVETEQLFCIYK